MRREWIEIDSRSEYGNLLVSPSMRREWIEILPPGHPQKDQIWSPSMRREWIEMFRSFADGCGRWSPSMRREWIEMVLHPSWMRSEWVSLHAEGVD